MEIVYLNANKESLFSKYNNFFLIFKIYNCYHKAYFRIGIKNEEAAFLRITWHAVPFRTLWLKDLAVSPVILSNFPVDLFLFWVFFGGGREVVPLHNLNIFFNDT